MKFYDWIAKKFDDWRGPAYGREGSVTGFAKWVGVSQQVMSSWLKKNGSIPTKKHTIDALIQRYGLEVYDVLDLPYPETEIKSQLSVWHEKFNSLSPDQREKLISFVSDFEIALMLTDLSQEEREDVKEYIRAKHDGKHKGPPPTRKSDIHHVNIEAGNTTPPSVFK